MSHLEFSVWNGKTTLECAGKKQTVYSIIQSLHELKMSTLVSEASKKEISDSELDAILDDLRCRGLVYDSKPGFIGCVDD